MLEPASQCRPMEPGGPAAEVPVWGQPNSTRCVRQRTQANAAGSINTFRLVVDPDAPLLSRLLSAHMVLLPPCILNCDDVMHGGDVAESLPFRRTARLPGPIHTSTTNWGPQAIFPHLAPTEFGSSLPPLRCRQRA